MTDLTARHGRLQREASLGGRYISSFRQVIIRHGLIMGAFLLLCLLTPEAIDTVSWGFSALLLSPLYYVIGLPAIFLLFLGYWSLTGRSTDKKSIIWLLYLLFISLVEEIVFRLILPVILLPNAGLLLGIILSNGIFATIHFFTLRWKVVNCIGAFLGGLAFSRLFFNTEDIALVILVHWVLTFLNTPAPPKPILSD